MQEIDEAQPAAPAVVGERMEGKTPWGFACEWYRFEEISQSIRRRVRTDDRDPSFIPPDVDSPPFAQWVTDQYRFAMHKGIEIGMSSRAAELERLRAECERLKSVLYRCAAAATATTGDEAHDIPALDSALKIPFASVDEYVSDNFCDLQCDVAQQQEELTALRAKLAEVEAQLESSLTTVIEQALAIASLQPAKEAAEQRAGDLTNLLTEVAASGISYTNEGRYHEVQIPADKFVQSLVKRADVTHPYPLWHGWALREAYRAGYEAAMKARAAAEAGGER